MDITLTPQQSKIFTSKARVQLIGGAAGGGKALSLDTKIPTPNGWKTMGDLKEGDQVFDECGKPCNVVAVTDVMFGRPCYEVTFSDGTKIVADEQHEWFTMDYKERSAWIRRTPEARAARRAKRPSRAKPDTRPEVLKMLQDRNSSRVYEYLERPSGTLRTTLEIFNTVKVRGNRNNHSIELCKPVEYIPTTDLPIDPWLLGMWLGDGTAIFGEITSADDHNIKRFSSVGYEVSKIKNKPYGYRIYGLQKDLRLLKVLGDKHIPQVYLTSSVKDRIELLHGLMDSDGYASSDGKCVFYNTNKVLIDGFMELVKSLGINATFTEDRAMLYGKDCGPAYNVYFNATFPVFSLPRRKERQAISKEQYRRRYIESVVKVDSVPVKCIEVDSASHLYLASESFIPTHNSLAIKIAAIQYCMQIPNLTFFIFRNSAPQLRSNYMEGGHSFPILLDEFVRAGQVRINYNELIIKFTHNNSQIRMRHLSHINEAQDILGVEIAACAVDECNQLNQELIRFIINRTRLGAMKEHIPPEIRHKFPFVLFATNPGGPSSDMIKRWFVDAAPWETEFESAEEFGGALSMFIPMKLGDNPHMEEDYRKSILALGDPIKIRQMLEGDWDASASTLMGHAFKRDKNVIKSIPKERFEQFRITRNFDYGFGSPAATVWLGELKDSQEFEMSFGGKRSFPRGTKVVLKEWVACKHDKPDEGLRLSNRELAETMLAKEQLWGLKGHVQVGCGDVFDKKGEYSIAEEMAKHGVRFKRPWKSSGSRAVGWSRMISLMLEAHKDIIEHPALLFTEECHQCIATIPALPVSPDDPDDCISDGGINDHAPDAVRYAVNNQSSTIGTMKVTGL